MVWINNILLWHGPHRGSILKYEWRWRSFWNMDKQVHRWKFRANRGAGERTKKVHQTVGRFEGGGGGGRGVSRRNVTLCTVWAPKPFRAKKTSKISGFCYLLAMILWAVKYLLIWQSISFSFSYCFSVLSAIQALLVFSKHDWNYLWDATAALCCLLSSFTVWAKLS